MGRGCGSVWVSGADTDAHTDSYRNSDADCYSNSDRHTDTDRESHRNRNRNPYRESDSDADSYRYLAESIRRHPDQQALMAMMSAAGLESCSYHNLMGGIVAVHYGVRY